MKSPGLTHYGWLLHRWNAGLIVGRRKLFSEGGGLLVKKFFDLRIYANIMPLNPELQIYQ
jgi:hypothetical protein